MTTEPALPSSELRAVFGTVDRSAFPRRRAVRTGRVGQHRNLACAIKSHACAVLKLLSGTQPTQRALARRPRARLGLLVREANAYESGLLTTLVGGLRGHAAFTSSRTTARSRSGWKRPPDVLVRPGRSTITHPRCNVSAARQGAFVVNGPPADEWLADSWLRSYLTQRIAFIDALMIPASAVLRDAIGEHNTTGARVQVARGTRICSTRSTTRREPCATTICTLRTSSTTPMRPC